MQQYDYSLTEIENMIPWELEIYMILLQNHLQEEKQRHDEQTRKMKS
jgi:hypothetical protein